VTFKKIIWLLVIPVCYRTVSPTLLPLTTVEPILEVIALASRKLSSNTALDHMLESSKSRIVIINISRNRLVEFLPPIGQLYATEI
jgi:hypothetical protein